jgi:zinc transport system permease protein
MLEAIMQYRFLQYAVVTGLLASVLSAVIGVIIVEKRLVMMSGGITHTAYGGVGMGYLFGFEPIIGAFAFAVAAALGMGYIKRKGKFRSDVVIGLFWSLGMALGMLFISMVKGYPPDLSSYLFGNILSVGVMDLFVMASVTAVVLIIVTVFFTYWKAYLFDDKFAEIRGINAALLDYLIFIMVAVSAVAMIRVVGIILVIALLTAPAASASLLTSGFGRRMFISGGLGAFFTLGGLWVSYALDISSGASIVMIAVVSYFLILAGVRLRSRYNSRKAKADDEI